jgi:hypothetical protein
MKNYFSIGEKLKEVDFFFEKMKLSEHAIDELNFYFSAFVSAARSVTFVMQYVGSDLEGFYTWYALIQQELRENKIAKFLLEARNEHLKRGVQPIASGSVLNLPNSQQKLLHFFTYIGSEPPAEVPVLDAITVCAIHMGTTTSLVKKFYERFSTQFHVPSQSIETALRYFSELAGELSKLGFPQELFDTVIKSGVIQEHAAKNPCEAIEHLIEKYKFA